MCASTRAPDGRTRPAHRVGHRLEVRVEDVPAPGLSALIARLPHALGVTRIHIPGPTYNEYAASFRAAGTRQEINDLDRASSLTALSLHGVTAVSDERIVRAG